MKLQTRIDDSHSEDKDQLFGVGCVVFDARCSVKHERLALTSTAALINSARFGTGQNRTLEEISFHFIII